MLDKHRLQFIKFLWALTSESRPQADKGTFRQEVRELGRPWDASQWESFFCLAEKFWEISSLMQRMD